LIELGVLDSVAKPVYFVRDNGVGFDMQYHSQLFLPFHKLHSSPEFAGSGLGLATARRIIQRHNGRIWVHAEPEQGAIFFFEF
jgi:light-regulated signal transduction histidine kinase (bacteriophytochrome)